MEPNQPLTGISRRNSDLVPGVSLARTVTPSPCHDLDRGDLVIAGSVTAPDEIAVLVRVTTSRGISHILRTPVVEGAFQCRYPRDFPGAPPLGTGFLFVDATGEHRDESPKGLFQAEAAVLVHRSGTGGVPEFPSAFTNDLLDAAGRTDRDCTEWPVIRSLVNLYMNSRAARLAGVGRAGFDLDRQKDLDWFKNNLTLYEFDHRDRDWTVPLGHRPVRTFWQAVWNTWFNSSNNNPLDGNDANKDPANFVPYAFANDFADILITYLLRLDLEESLDDNLDSICQEGLTNLLAMQHRREDNFALRDKKGRLHTYTAGAFRYGMFESGQWMTEGTGWFYNPNFADYVNGGVFNGRAIWCVGEGLKRYHHGQLGERLKNAMSVGLRFCLYDALDYGYAHKTPSGLAYWYDPGESGYLLLGMISACEVCPDTVIQPGPGRPEVTLRDLTVLVLDAMVELMQSHGQWQEYADKDSMVIAALADGARMLAGHPHMANWQKAATVALDGWLEAQVDARECPYPPVNLPHRRTAPHRATFLWNGTDHDPGRKFIFLYSSGHWIHALAKMYDLTRNCRYRQRAEAIVGYLCGANPWNVRLLNETGGVYNWVEDTDRDGFEDWLKQDMYPESTAFCQIGINHLIRAINHHTPRT